MVGIIYFPERNQMCIDELNFVFKENLCALWLERSI